MTQVTLNYQLRQFCKNRQTKNHFACLAVHLCVLIINCTGIIKIDRTLSRTCELHELMLQVFVVVINVNIK